jgi:hypothetical protein
MVHALFRAEVFIEQEVNRLEANSAIRGLFKNCRGEQEG